MNKHTFIFALFLFFSSYASEKLDGIAAIIGDSIILMSELDAYVGLRMNQEPTMDSSMIPALRKQLLNELIDGKVLIAHAEKDTTITITSQEIEDELQSRIQYILKQNQLSPQDFEQLLLKEQGLTVTTFKKKLRQQIRQELLKQKVQQRYIASIKVTKKDVEQFYTEFKDSLPDLGESILLSVLTVKNVVADSVREKAFAKISQVKLHLDKGEDFATCAKQFSEDASARGGGDLGFIAKGTLNELAFEEKIFSLTPMVISEPFETRLGFHLIQVLEKIENKVHVRHIFVSITPPEEQKQATLNLLDSLSKTLVSASLFEQAVVQLSMDPVTKPYKGKLNWQTVTSLPSSVRSSFDSLYVGAVSKPVQENTKFSIYRIDSIAEHRTYALSDNWNELLQLTQQRLMQKKLLELVTLWRKNLYIDIRL